MTFDKIYFDMDGVVADFCSGVRDLAGFDIPDQAQASKETDDLMWAAIAAVPHFYDKLDLMPGAKEMFDYVYGKYGDKVEILTAVPKPKRGIPTAGEDKITWVHRMLSPDVKINIVMREDKKKFCTGKNSLLIDDLASNQDEWSTYGGIGILNISAEKTLEEFKKFEAMA